MLKNTCSVGATSEAMVAGYLSYNGYEVFFPRQDHGRADLVYLKDGIPVRVQIKTASTSKGTSSAYRYEMCRLVRANGMNTPYTSEEIDEIWIVGTHLWCLPISVVIGLTSITLLSDNPKPRKTVRTYDTNPYIKVMGSFERPYRNRLFFDELNPTIFETNHEYDPETLRTMRYKKVS